MSSQLSKLHVRYIQAQKSFLLFKDAESGSIKLPLSQLYVKDNSSFYLINQQSPLAEKRLTMLFKEATDVLNSLKCNVSAAEVDKKSDEFQEALLFFNVEPPKIKQVLCLSIDTLEEK